MSRTTVLLIALAALLLNSDTAQARYRGGMNLYAYVGGMPTKYVDPSGYIGFGPGGGPGQCTAEGQCGVDRPPSAQPTPTPGGSNGASWDDLLAGLLNEKEVASFCASMPIGVIPPFGVITGKACATGSVKACRKKDGNVGAMFCGTLSASIAATFPPVPTAPSVTVGKDPKNKGVHVFEKGTSKSGKTVRRSCPQDKYFSDELEGSGGGPLTSSPGKLPPCETKTTGKISLDVSCSAGGGPGSITGVQPIGTCNFPGGCNWGGRPTGSVDWGWTKPHASCSLTGSGSITGCINLSGD